MAQRWQDKMEGKQIGNFKILQKLGEGGMGVVYKGIDLQLDRPVAIKMLSPELTRNPELVQRFQAEARAQANLNHTNIATLYGFLVTDEGACMVMEFVEGESFEQLIRRGGPMNPRDAVPLFKQALLGIGAAHRMGIVHRDIKPANLMLNRQGIVKVMDFGIAKAVGTRGMTRTGMQMGTVLYMSPEQIQSRTIDTRTDIYALGVTLYEMLSGHVPFESDSDFQVMHDHVNTPTPPLTRYYPYAAKEFENVVAKALEKNPDNRFQTVEEFGAALEHPENVPAPTHSMAAPAPVRGTIIEGNVPAAAALGVGAAAPAVAPVPTSTGATPPPGGPAAAAPPLAPGAVPAPARAGSMRNKAIIGVLVAAAVVMLGIVLRPKPPAPPPGGASSGVQTSSNKPGPAPPQNNTPNVLVATGGGPASATSSTITSGSTNRPARQKAAPVSQPQGTSVQSQGQSGQDQQAQAQPPQPQVQQPQAQPPAAPPQQQPAQPMPQPQQQAQPQQQVPQGRSFPVKHRHLLMRGLQSFTYFCGGWLTIKPDGSATYVCTGTNDPSGRCDRVAFPAGSIRDAKLRNGELHISTSGMGNWDFFDLNVAGSTAAAYQALMAPSR